MNKNQFLVISVLSFLLICGEARAEKLTIIYTGQADAALFPCHCPAEPAGGISRRATIIKELRRENPDLLLLEAGDGFAGGIKDYLTQGDELDKQRTRVYLSSLSLMGYDVLGSGEGSLKYGQGFLVDSVKKTRLAIIGLNVPGLKPYVIRNVGGIKVAIIGFGAYKLDCSGCHDADKLKNLIKKLKKEGAGFIIVLSDRELEQDFKLLKQVDGINCILNSNTSINNQKPVIEVGGTLIALSYWQARRISRLDLNIHDAKLMSFKYSQIKLTPDVADDAKIENLLTKYPDFKR